MNEPRKKRIGIVGGGQLGRMLAEAAHKLGFTVAVLDPTSQCPASAVADRELIGDFKDEAKIRELAKESDFLTFEIELANSAVLRELMQQGITVHPSPDTLHIIKDKLGQKQFLAAAGIPVAPFTPINSRDDARAAGATFGYPFMLKARSDAYDGRGNAVVREESDIDAACAKLNGRLLYAEQYIPFEKELAVVAARDVLGNVSAYPVVETIHRNNICHMVLAPAPVADATAEDAERVAARVLEALQGVGVFGIELFLSNNGSVLVNEIAPRVHNSGHFTIEASPTSQFEEHIRAITGLPLGPTHMSVPAAVMINILGDRSGPALPQGVDQALKLGRIGVHIYGKHETRPERKMGHITAVGQTLDEARRLAEMARKLISV